MPEIVGQENLPGDYLAGVARWKPNLTMFVTHYALSEAPRFRMTDGLGACVTMGALESLDAYAAMLAAFRAGKIDLREPVFLALTPSVIDASEAKTRPR